MTQSPKLDFTHLAKGAAPIAQRKTTSPAAKQAAPSLDAMAVDTYARRREQAGHTDEAGCE